MRTKSLLLGAAAAIAITGAAGAADLPMTKGEAIEYVKTCSTFGPGFFYIPGSDTCLKIGGEIRADYRVYSHSDFNRDNNRSAFGTEGRIWFDARTQTDYGLLRSYFQINASGRTASRSGSGTQNAFFVGKAFIQFGGLTAGYAHSFYGFYDFIYGNTIWAPYYAESKTVNLLAYTAQFGDGLTATLALEDGRTHSLPVAALDPVTVAYGQGGQNFPDVVANIFLDQSWGTLQASAALHEFRANEAAHVAGYDDKWGYAVGASAAIKFPQLIDGGHFVVEGSYADGAAEYLGLGSAFSGAFGHVDTAGVAGARANFKSGKGWSIVAELGGKLTPSLVANMVGSYIDVKADHLGVENSLREYTATANLTYTIVKGLSVGVEATYIRPVLVGSVYDADTETTANNVKVKSSIWQGGVRLKRSF